MNLNNRKMKNNIPPPIFFIYLKLIYTARATNSTRSKDYQCMSCIASDVSRAWAEKPIQQQS